jgi:hypothetical protein
LALDALFKTLLHHLMTGVKRVADLQITKPAEKGRKRSPSSDLFGKRPGDETDEQVRRALEELDGRLSPHVDLAVAEWAARCGTPYNGNEGSKIMNRIVVKIRVRSDGSLHVDLPAGSAEPDTDVQGTVEPWPGSANRTLLASDLLQSGLVGLWAERNDMGDSREFARRLRQQAQTRGQDCHRAIC